MIQMNLTHLIPQSGAELSQPAIIKKDPRGKRFANLRFRFGGVVLATTALLATDALAQKRNILLLIADDLGADSSTLTNSEASGASLPQTPHIDSLAENGVVFTNAYTRPSCSATRAALLTGRHAFRTGVGFAITGASTPQLKIDEYTLPRAFAAHAPEYGVASFGKWHLGLGVDTPWTHGGWPHFAGVNGPQPSSFTNWTKIKNGTSFNSTTYVTTDQVDESISWINEQEQADKPWFAWVAFSAPHEPFHRPPEHLLSERFAHLTGTSQDINARPREYFEALTEALDKEIGRLLEAVDRENTDIIFIGDNGTIQRVQQPPYRLAGHTSSNHQAKFTVNEGGVRVPLVVSGPSAKYAGRNSTLVDVVDVFQLVQELAGINVNETVPEQVVVDSKSIIPALESNVEIPSDLFVEQFNRGQGRDGQALRNRDYKIIRLDSKIEKLYHLAEDPYEATDLLANGGVNELTPEARANYYSLKRKFQQFLGLPNTVTRVRDEFPVPVHRTFTKEEGTVTISYDYDHLRTASVHTLWRTPDLNDPLAWVPVATKEVAAIPTGTPLTTSSDSFTDTAPEGSQFFYQVVPSLW